jgi:mRNA interferase RelE/StbE
MTFRIRLSRDARNVFSHLEPSDKRKISGAIDSLAVNPRPRGCVKLEGYDALYRIRKGDWRIVYEILDEEIRVYIVRIGRRKDIYRALLR